MKQRKLKKPPKSAEWLLKKVFDENVFDSAVCDIEEAFKEKQKSKGYLFSVVWYWIQVVKSYPLFMNNLIYWRFSMFKNYLKIAFRNMKRNKGYTFINVFGLALGIASCLLIFSYVNYHLSFDKYHENSDRIYRFAAVGEMSGSEYSSAAISAAMAPLLIDDYPQIEKVVRFSTDRFNKFRYKDKKFYEPYYYFADGSAFDVFSYKLLKGDPKTALEDPNTVVLSSEAAYRYFGDEDPIGKMINFEDKIDLTVTGIMERPPANSHLQIDILISMKSYDQHRGFHRRSRWTYTYVLLKKGVPVKEFETVSKGFFDKHLSDLLKPMGGKLMPYIQPITSIHLHSNLGYDNPGNINFTYIYVFAVIALFILLIASVNYINLSTARSAVRAKEVGIRKVFGAVKVEIIKQFIGESFVYVILASISALILVMVSLPYFKDLSGINISMQLMEVPSFWLSLFLILFSLCFIAGGYPAIFLSRYKPVKTLKGIFVKGGKSSSFRNSLVVFQLTILVILIIMTTGITRQIEFLKNRNLGFDKEHVLFTKFPASRSSVRPKHLFKDEVKALSGVVNVSYSLNVPGTNYYLGQYLPEGFPENQSFSMEISAVDEDYLNTLGLEIVEGRGFSKEIFSDSRNAMVINETAAKMIGWENPIGKKITDLNSEGNISYQVIGVVKDFHSRSLHYTIEPLVFISTSEYHDISMRIRPGNVSHTMSLIEKKWKEFFPYNPFVYSFLDDTFDNLYRTENRLMKVISVFTLLSIFIGALGLFGLVSFMTEQRTKEIGIRKTLGATSGSLSFLLIKDLSKWILLANLISLPLGYFILNQWLRNFAYKAGIGWQVFVFSGLTALFLSLITVGKNVLKAANSNPVDSLRYE
ncbi:ABC transporter permease [candidate division KSB1 bacterium]